jgi:hypothetical protein
LDCGGKQSATPLWEQDDSWSGFVKSAVAASLCQRSPKAIPDAMPFSTVRFDFENAP